MTHMKGKIFFDTNVLLYAYIDNQLSAKHKICLKLVEGVFNGETEGVISNQVLGEFSNVFIVRSGASVEDTERAVSELIASDNWTKLNYNSDTVKKALGTCRIYKTPFWDSVIAETMKENSITNIITENDKDFDRIPGIMVTNPLKS